jgi:hypothetical protein
MPFPRPVALWFLTASIAALPLRAQAPDRPEPPDPPPIHHGQEPRVSILDDVTVESGLHERGIVCVRGDVKIDGEVEGDVVVIAGSLQVNGTVSGTVVAVASPVDLGDHAVIKGDLTNVAGSLDRGDAEIRGSVVNVSPSGLGLPSFGSGWDRDWAGWSPLAFLFPWGTLLGLFLFFVGAIVLSAVVPDRIRLISQETPVSFFTAFLFGLLGYMLLAMTLLVLCITIIGIPIAFLVYCGFVILKWMAMCGLFHYVGARLARSLNINASFLGAILLGLVPFALIRLIPTCCFGFTVWFAVEIVAFGLLINTRLGTRPSSVLAQPPAPIPPPPTPPVPPIVPPPPAPPA